MELEVKRRFLTSLLLFTKMFHEMHFRCQIGINSWVKPTSNIGYSIITDKFIINAGRFKNKRHAIISMNTNI